VHGGLAYTVDWDGQLTNPDHYWWPVAEAISTSSYLLRLTGKVVYETWYRRFWDYASEVLVDHKRGGWYPMFDQENRPKVFPWHGKPDIYHALQACLLPVLPVAPSFVGAIQSAGGLRATAP
jgi:mannose/cellobiose epimerase-like protein (N-acyl-D-glucosamine 2-epimerase family)